MRCPTRSVSALWPILLLAGCAAARAPVLPPSTCGGEPNEVLACVRAHEDALVSMRARFTATVRPSGDSTTGVLLVSKPARFRLRLMLPFGLTVFDCVKDGDRVQVTLPLQGRTHVAGASPLPFATADLEEAFLRGNYAFPGTCAAENGPRGTVLVHCDAGARRRELVLDARTATLVEETSYENGAARMVLAYAAYRPVDEAGIGALPYEIHLRDPVRGISLDIAIDAYEVNPHLSPDLFRLVSP